MDKQQFTLLLEILGQIFNELVEIKYGLIDIETINEKILKTKEEGVKVEGEPIRIDLKGGN